MPSTIAFFFLAQAPVSLGGETLYFERIPNLPTHPTYAAKDETKIVNGYLYRADGQGWWIRERQVSPQADPFELPRQLPVAVADDSEPRHGPWPEGIDFPKGMVWYYPAENTQEIAVTNGRDRISRVPRRLIEAKYRVPGGMVGLAGWRSDLYYSGHVPQDWVGNIPVWNGYNYQNNRGWLRAFPVGTTFMDVLSNTKTGNVFEVRIRRKEDNGRWHSFVDYRNPLERPAGYTGLRTDQCASCHKDAGTGGYAVGLAPGGDECFSLPFTALE